MIEQNRDAQMRSLLVNELDIDPKKLVPVLHYSGSPITARNIVETVQKEIEPKTQVSAKQVAAKEA